jgi:hypothetical protein
MSRRSRSPSQDAAQNAVQASKAPRLSCLTEKDGETCPVCAKPRARQVCKRRGQLERAAASASGAVRSTGRDSDSRKLYSPSRESLSVLELTRMAGGRLEHRATGARSVQDTRRAEARGATTSHGSSSIPMSSLGSPAVGGSTSELPGSTTAMASPARSTCLSVAGQDSPSASRGATPLRGLVKSALPQAAASAILHEGVAFTKGATVSGLSKKHGANLAKVANHVLRATAAALSPEDPKGAMGALADQATRCAP